MGPTWDGTTTSQKTALQYSAGTPAVETHLQKQNRSHSHLDLRPIYIGQIAYSPKVMECGSKPEDPESAQADSWRMCKDHTPWPQGGLGPRPFLLWSDSVNTTSEIL